MDDLIPEIDPALPEPDFFDAEDGDLHLSAVTNDVLLSQQLNPESVVECVAGAELKYDDDLCEFNEFLINVEATAGKNPDDEEKVGTVGIERQNGSEVRVALDTSSMDKEATSPDVTRNSTSEKSDNQKSDGEDEVTSHGSEKNASSANDSASVISHSSSGGPNTPASKASSTARVSLSLPVAPKISFTSRSSSSTKKGPLASPPRLTRGSGTLLNKNDVKAKRKLSDDEEYEPEEDNSDIGTDIQDKKVKTTRSGRQTRRTTRFRGDDDYDDEEDDEEPEKNTKRSRRVSRKVVRYGKETKDDYNSNSKIDSSERDSSPDSVEEIVEPVKKRKKRSNYWTDDNGVTYHEDDSGKVSTLKPCTVNVERLTDAAIVKLTGGQDLFDDSDNPFLLEVCIDNFLSAAEAVKGGAKRIELCSSLTEGGLTPSGGFLTLVKEKFNNTRVFVMIRPRGGDFVYSTDEIEIMNRDISHYKQMGADGFVFGILTKDCKVDVENCKLLLKTAYPLECTFHRAFDKVVNPMSALETIISMGFSRILTSGQAATAHNGIPLLRRLVDTAGSRIKILAGAGLTESNVGDIVRRTGVREVHGSASKSVASSMCAAGPSKSHKRGGPRSSASAVKMGTTDDSVIKVTDSNVVANIVKNGRKQVRR